MYKKTNTATATSSRRNGAPDKKAGAKDKKFTYVNTDLTELLDFIAGSIEAGKTVHINVENGSLRFRNEDDVCYSKRLKVLDDGSLYGSIKPEESVATADFSSFQRRELAQP